MRSPVKLPGPLVTAMRSMSPTVSSASRSISCSMGIRVTLWVWPSLANREARRAPSSAAATDTALAEVSKANIFKGQRLL